MIASPGGVSTVLYSARCLCYTWWTCALTLDDGGVS